MIRNINSAFGDSVEFVDIKDMEAGIIECGYILPPDGLREGRDYEFVGPVMYMNLYTGSVATKDDWWYEAENGEQVNAVDLGEAVEVERDESGDWIEV